MKVLLLSLHHPELMRGGAQQVCYELYEGLMARPDIEPTLLCAVDDQFSALFKSGARITGFDGRPGEYLFLSRGYDYRWHRMTDEFLISSFIEFLELLKPDVVHFHHFLLFGLDLVTLTRRVLPNARIVFTLHEFLSICDANGHMVRKFDGTLCTRASPVRCHQCFPDRSPEEFFLREMWVKRHFDQVDVFTTPTRFMIKHFTDWGLDARKLVHVTNGQRDYSGGVLPAETGMKRNRFAFFGQMVDAKGIQIILRAVEHLRSEGFTDFSVELNGDNLRYATPAYRKEIEDFLAREQELPAPERLVRNNGSYHVDQLRQRMSRADWCIVPSTWWEIFGLVISEAWMFGRPVIASNVGGPAERIQHEINGLHFDVADPVSLAHTMRRAASEGGLWDRLHATITPPPAREAMVEGFVEVYREARNSDVQLRAVEHQVFA